MFLQRSRRIDINAHFETHILKFLKKRIMIETEQYMLFSNLFLWSTMNFKIFMNFSG